MHLFRPRLKIKNVNTKRKLATGIGLATVITGVVALVSMTNLSTQAKNSPTLNAKNWNTQTNSWNTTGDWYRCDGTVDNDSAHHSLNLNDHDPAHHVGMVCLDKNEAWKPGLVESLIHTGEGVNLPTKPEATQTASTNQTPLPPDQSALNPIETVTQTPTPAPQQPQQTSQTHGNPFAGEKLYMNYNNDPANYVRTHQGTYQASQMKKIADQPEVVWLGGWNWNIAGDVANFMNNITSQGALPVFVVYNIPNRDCGGYSAGGVGNPWAYRDWVSQIANTIGSRKAVVILEPDAITLTDCLSPSARNERFEMLRDAVNIFKSKGNISVYIDAGHPDWHSASEISNRLKNAGIDKADGFSLNIANFYTNSQNAEYGRQISELTGGKHFIVDTGRNGSGPTPNAEWCNPWGRSLGAKPTTNTGNPLIDAYLWVKGPSGSDGNCNGGPSAGQFWPEYAIGLAERTNW